MAANRACLTCNRRIIETESYSTCLKCKNVFHISCASMNRTFYGGICCVCDVTQTATSGENSTHPTEASIEKDNNNNKEKEGTHTEKLQSTVNDHSNLNGNEENSSDNMEVSIIETNATKNTNSNPQSIISVHEAINQIKVFPSIQSADGESQTDQSSLVLNIYNLVVALGNKMETMENKMETMENKMENKMETIEKNITNNFNLQIQNIRSMVDNNTGEIKELDNKVEEISGKNILQNDIITTLQSRVEKLEEDVDHNNNNESLCLEKISDSEILEIHNRMQKLNNIMIYGVNYDYIKNDFTNLKKLLQETFPEVNFVNFLCLGVENEENNPRPIRATLQNRYQANLVMNNKDKIKEESWSITFDRTFKQRRHFYSKKGNIRQNVSNINQYESNKNQPASSKNNENNQNNQDNSMQNKNLSVDENLATPTSSENNYTSFINKRGRGRGRPRGSINNKNSFKRPFVNNQKYLPESNGSQNNSRKRSYNNESKNSPDGLKKTRTR